MVLKLCEQTTLKAFFLTSVIIVVYLVPVIVSEYLSRVYFYYKFVGPTS